MNTWKPGKIIVITFLICVSLVFFYFIWGQLVLPSDQLDPTNFFGQYRVEWSRVLPDGTREPVEVPGRCQAEKNEKIRIESVIPDSISAGRYLCFRSAKQDVQIYIDGKLRESYSTKERRLFGRTSAVAYLFLELEEGDAGKTLVLETQTDSSYSGIFYAVYQGDRMGIWQYYFSQYGIELIVAFLLFVFSIISIVGSMILRISYHRIVELEYLGWGILLASLWLITNSVFRQLLFPNLAVVNDITFLMILLLPIPFLLYMDAIQKGRYHLPYQIMEGVVFADFFVCTFLHVTNLCDFTDSISFVGMICVSAVLCITATIVADAVKRKLKQYWIVAAGIMCVLSAAVLQIVIYFRRTSMFNGVVLAVGLIVLLAFATVNTMREIVLLDREKQQALTASEAKGRFLANMSHEIRTPINAVLGMDAMILRETKDSQIKEYALDIQNAGQSLLALINDILDLSKIESGKMEIIEAEYDISSLIHDIMNMIYIKAQTKELQVDLFVDENLPSRLWGDDIRLRQILTNLMNNAVKYTETGSVTLTVKDSQPDGVYQEGDCLELLFEVEDTGMGIKEEDRNKLFQEFSRVEEQKNRNIEGTGLGLSITAQLLQMMETTLQVESTYGKGSKFFFRLKQKIMDAKPVGRLEERIRNQVTKYSYQVMFTAPKARVLVADDNAVNRKLFVNLLKATKIKVDEAAGGLECLVKVQERHYDMILIDHMMPDLDGIETLHRMREWDDFPCKDTPVVAITANAIAGAKEMYLEEGFDDFFSKPINPQKLEKMLAEYLPKEKVHYEKKTEAAKTEEPEEEPEALPEIDGIDWNYALLHTKDYRLLRQTVFDFYRLMESDAQQLEWFFKILHEPSEYDEQEAETLRQYRVKVHAMKSSAAIIGAVSLSGIARMLEYAARDGKREVLEKMTPLFLDAWRTLKEDLKEFAEQGNDGEEKAEPDYLVVDEYLDLIKGAMEDMDIDIADEIIKRLDRFRYPPKIEERMEDLRMAVANLDAEQTIKCADALYQIINEMGDDI